MKSDASPLGLLHVAPRIRLPVALLPAFALLALTLLLSVLLVWWWFLPRPIPGIPYNKESAWSWYGDAKAWREHTLRTGEGWTYLIHQSAKHRSPIVQVFQGSKPIVVVTDHREIHDLAIRRRSDFDRGGALTEFFKLAVPEGTISMPSHAAFKAQRNVWASTMTSAFLHSVSAPQIHAATQQLVAIWKAKARLAPGLAFEANADVRLSVFCNIWAVSFGETLPHLDEYLAALNSATPTLLPSEARFPPARDPDMMAAIDVILLMLDASRSAPWPALHQWLLRRDKTYAWAADVKHSSMKALLTASRARFAARSDSEVRCAMDQIYRRQAAGEDRVLAVTDGMMEDELFSFIVGGHESSQQNFSWGMKYLSTHRDAQTRLRSSLHAAFPSSAIPTATEIASTPCAYLDACIEETLRLAGTNSGVLRVATRDTVLLGARIPAGTDVFGAHTAEPLHERDWATDEALRSESSRAQAEKYRHWAKGSKARFEPERWLDAAGNFDREAGPSMPFGAGTRACFGQRLARLTLRIMFVLVYLQLDLQATPPELSGMRAAEKMVRGPALCYVCPRVL